jgi:hypothetical protein
LTPRTLAIAITSTSRASSDSTDCVGPQSTFRPSCLGFCGYVGGTIRLGLLALVPFEVPRHAAPDLLQADIDADDRHLAYPPAIALELWAPGLRVLVEGEIGQGLLREVAERLAALRCVDAIKPDLVLDVAAVEQGQRVAVRNADDPALQLASGGAGRRAASRINQRLAELPPHADSKQEFRIRFEETDRARAELNRIHDRSVVAAKAVMLPLP